MFVAKQNFQAGLSLLSLSNSISGHDNTSGKSTDSGPIFQQMYYEIIKFNPI